MLSNGGLFDKKMRKILIIAPHIDDEAIGCGGSILKHAALGNLVEILYIFTGSKLEKEVRKREARIACKFMGVNKFYFLKKSKSFEKIELNVIKILRNINPDYIYIPHGKEVDSDHKFVHDLVMGSVWKANGKYFPNIGKRSNIVGVIQYEIHTPILNPNYFEDISNFASKKRELISIYKSQNKKTNYVKGILGLNQYRGIFREVGDYSEAFNLKMFRNLFDDGSNDNNTGL